MESIHSFFDRLPDILRKRKILVLTGFIIITVVLAAGSGKMKMDNSLDSFFADDDPVKVSYDRFKQVFEGDEYIYVVYRAKDGDIFSDGSLEALKGLYNELTRYHLTGKAPSPLDHIVEIKSLININYLEASDDTLYSRPFIGDRLPTNEKERDDLRKKALNHPDYPFVFLSQDCRYGGILLRTDFNSEPLETQGDETAIDPFGEDDMFKVDVPEALVKEPEVVPGFKKTGMDEYAKVVSTLRKILAKEPYINALEFHPVGKPVLMDFFADAVLSDLGRIMGMVFLLILVMLVVLFRSLSAVVWPVVVIVSGLVWLFGIIGWSGVTMSVMVQIMMFLMLAVGVADAVHILSGYLHIRNTGTDHDPALHQVMRKSGLACFLTSATTAAGLLSLALVPVKPIAVFGLFSAMGVLIAFVLTMMLMPLMLDVWSPFSVKRPGKGRMIQAVIQIIGSAGLTKPGWVITVFALVSVVLGYGLMQLRVDSNDIEVLKKGYPLRASYEIVNDHLGGSGNLEVALDFKRGNALKDPAVLNEMEALQRFLMDHEGSTVVNTLSLVNAVKESNKALHNDDPAFYTIPRDPQVMAQTLFLFENANPTDRRRLVTDDYSQARVGIRTTNMGSVDALAFMEKIQAYMDQHFAHFTSDYPAMNVTMTGHMALLAAMLDHISWSQIRSFGLTLVVISLALFMVFGSVKAGILAMIPNIFPILTTFGIMGFWGIPLDMDTLLIAPIIIGLAVDDTIHFLTHYRLELDRFGDVRQASIHVLKEAGQAIAFTSLILAAGFSMFVLTFHNGLSHFGILSAIAILTACLADLCLLPALVAFFKLDFRKKASGGRLLKSWANTRGRDMDCRVEQFGPSNR